MKALVILAALCLPVAAPAFEWGGRLGFSWTRQDDWRDLEHDVSNILDLDLGLRFRTFVFDPQIAWIRGGANFRLYDRSADGARLQRTDTYTYSLAGALYDRPGSPFTVNANAQRVVSELSGPHGAWFGSRTSDAGAVSATLQLPARPGLRLGYSWDLAADELPGLGVHDRTLHRLDTAVSHHSPAFNLTADYRGEWSDGSWDADAYQVNTVRVEGSAQLSRQMTFGLSDQYYQRTPTESFDAALAAESHTLQAGLRNVTAPREEQGGRYIYSRSSSAAAAILRRAATSQRLEYWNEFRLDDTDYSGRATANVALVDQTLGSATTRSSGETAGFLGRWARKSGQVAYDVQAGPSLSLLQNEAGDSRFGYGANGSLLANRPLWGMMATGRYEAAYGNDLGGIQGWSFHQAVTAAGEGAAGAGILSAQLRLEANRTWSPLYGDFASRNVFATGSYAVDRTRLFASFSFGSGITGNPGDKFVGDGLLLPAPFNTHTLFANVSASRSTSFGVTASAGLRFGASDAPGQPAIIQKGLDASLEYAFAAFRVALDERLTTYDYPTGSVTTNLVFLRLTREIGDSF
ncbi:MAG: hypothetical protein WCC48_13330 [Anaeromyxobacteraceae bacterium]